jgi:hypothetical protein
VTAGADPRSGDRLASLRVAAGRGDLDRLAPAGLALAVTVSGLLLLHLTRGSSFWVDDWNFVTQRRGDSVHTFLSPYQGHLSLVPIAIYRALFAVFGIGSYTPYRVIVIGLSIVVAILLYIYAQARIGGFGALLLTALMLFLGPGWEDTMWAFQVAWLIVAAAGITALLALDRRGRTADVVACLCVLLAICSTSVGIAVAVGIAVDLAVVRRRWRDGWIVAGPLVLYSVWALHYHPVTITASTIPSAPGNAVQAAAAALSALTGLSGTTPLDQTGQELVYGIPLLIGLLIAAGRQVARRRVSARAFSLLIMLVAFTVMVTLVRGETMSLLASRYVYFYSLFVALAVAELARGTHPGLRTQTALTVLCAFALVANFGAMRAAGAFLRALGVQTDSALTVLDLDQAYTPPQTLVEVGSYPFERLRAGAYFAARRALGTPAFALAQMLRTGDLSAADGQLSNDGTIAIAAGGPPVASLNAAAGTTTTASASTDGTVAPAGGCARLVPSAAMAPAATGVFTVELPRRGAELAVHAGAAPVTVTYRRFATTFSRLGEVRADREATVHVRRDGAGQPWYVQVASSATLRVCRAGGS